MSELAIQCEGISKRYRLGEFEPYKTLRESIMRTAGRILHRPSGASTQDRHFWALKDVSFDVRQGEVVGIIGRNGAGKSTLLKILSRITDPTDGQATLRGRVGSLLEVGTGFHPELTGRENIYLNGAILGMSRADIRRRFDEIVAFAEVERFLDTPVKRYSSGMYVRLAFAVAAHLEPEILIVDEVLSVGDAEFQKKCLGKMSGVASEGRTVLFVSHNMAAVQGLCSRAILLCSGRLTANGTAHEVVSRYQAASAEVCYDIGLASHPHRVIRREPVLKRLRLTDESGAVLKCVPLGAPVCFEVHMESACPLPAVTVGIHISNSLGSRVLTFHSRDQMKESLCLAGPTIVRCAAESCRLMPGQYSIVLAVATGGETVDRIEPCGEFEVVERDIFGTGKAPPARDGVFVSKADWSIVPATQQGQRHSERAT